LADRRLRADALADPERLPEDAVEQRPRRGGIVGGPHLPEDLALTRDERVEPGRDAEEVDRGRLVVEAVRDRRQRLPRQLLERLDRTLDVAVCEVHLGAEARREADGVAEPARELGRTRGRHDEPLAQLDRRDTERETDQRQPQKCLPASTRRTRITSAKPPSSTCAPRRPPGRAARKPP